VEIFREKCLAIVSYCRDMVVEGGYGQEDKIKKLEKQKTLSGRRESLSSGQDSGLIDMQL